MATLAALATTATVVSAQGRAAAPEPPLRVAVVISESGGARTTGLAQRAALMTVRGGDLAFEFFDDASDPARAARLVERSVAEGAEAVICCSTEAASARAAAVAREAGVLLLAPTRLPGGDPGTDSRATSSRFAFTLAPDDATDLRSVVAHAFAEGKVALGLMTLDNAFGATSAERLAAELGVAGMALVADERYPPGARVLTPEALWVASRLPGAVVVWGLASDTQVAVDALRRRGYAGPVYLRGALARAGLDPAVVAGARVPVVPAAVASALPPGHPNAVAARRLAGELRGVYGYPTVPSAAAHSADAAAVLVRAREQAALYGVPRDRLASYRQALRDAAVALPPLAGAGGTPDLREGEVSAATPAGSVVAAFARDGSLELP